MTREEAIAVLMNSNEYHHAKGDLPHSALSVEAFNMAIDALKERPHGEWIKVEFRTLEEKMFYGDAYRCSHCDMISDTHGTAPYCENCGADMREGDAE